MKKAKIFSLIALTLCFIMVFASCGAGSMMKYFNPDVEEEKVFASSAKVEGLGTYLGEKGGDLVLFSDESVDGKVTYKVYNVETGTVVYTQELAIVLDGDVTTLDFDLYEIGDDVSYFIVNTYVNEDLTNSKLFGEAGGTAIAECTVDPDYEEYYDEVIVFNGAAYSVDENGAIVKTFDVDEFNPLVEADYVGVDYVYVVDDGVLAVYDKKGGFVSGYTFKGYGESIAYGVLGNGNFMIQYVVELPEDATSYDIFEEGTKLDLVTEIVNVKNGSAKEIEVDFIIDEEIYNAYSDTEFAEYYGMVEDFDLNLAEITYIVDGYIDDSTEVSVILDNNLKVKATIDDVVEGAEYISAIADNIFYVYDKYENIHFIDENGKVIKTIASESVESINSKYIATENAIYDLTFTKVYDLKANKYEIESTGYDFFILTKETDDGTEYARFNNGAVTVIVAAGSETTFYGSFIYSTNLYYVRTVGDTTTYTYYNGAGTVVGTFESLMSVISETENAAIVRVGTDYYRLAKA